MSSYCARQDVYAIGLAAEAFRRPPREVEGVVPSTGILTIRSHGLALDTPLTLVVESSSTLGAHAAAPPTGSAVGTLYYALPVAGSSDLFQIAVAPNGSPLTFSDVGTGIFGMVVDHGPYLDAAIVAASAILDQCARAHDPPIAAPVFPLVCAFLAVRIYVAAHTVMNPAFTKVLEGPSWLRGLLDKLFALWIAGADVVGAVDATPLLADDGAVSIELEGRDFLGRHPRDRA